MGSLQPIQPSVGVKLQENEQVYAEFEANRMALVDGETSKSFSHSSGVASGVFGHGFGLGSGLSSGRSVSKTTATKEVQVIDQGTLLLTNKRFIFIGHELVSILYSEVEAVNFAGLAKTEEESFVKLLKDSNTFKNNLTKQRAVALIIHHAGSTVGEQYLIGGSNGYEAIDTYEAISQAYDAPKMGTKPGDTPKTSNKSFWIVLAVIVFPPAGLPLMFKYTKLSMKAKITIAIVWGIIWLVAYIASLSHPQASIYTK